MPHLALLSIRSAGHMRLLHCLSSCKQFQQRYSPAFVYSTESTLCANQPPPTSTSTFRCQPSDGWKQPSQLLQMQQV